MKKLKTFRQEAEQICYGRDDLLNVSEKICHEFGNNADGEDLCQILADAAIEYLSNIVQTRWF